MSVTFHVWGLSGTLAVEHERDATFAEERLWWWIDALDAACNRFRSDSEITRLNASAGSPVLVSATMELVVDAALRASDATEGLCDPTVLGALLDLGYDRDYDEVARRDDWPAVPARPAPGRRAVSLNRDDHTVTLTPGCGLDVGASAKALLVDRVCDELAPRGGALVEVGGDVALRGRGPDGPWVIGVADQLTLHGAEPRVTMGDGGLATSSTTTRTWRAGGVQVNHIIDPRRGTCARGPYATATVAASSCLLANAMATASLLWGEEAGYRLGQAGYAARLVRHDGTVEYVGGWPDDAKSLACSP